HPTDDVILKVQDRVLAKLAATGLEHLGEDMRVAGLIRALTCQEHPHFPLRIRKLDEGASRTFRGVHFLVHLTVHELHDFPRIIVSEVRALIPALDDGKPFIAQRGVRKPAFRCGVGHGAYAPCCSSKDSRSCCLSSAVISSSLNSASRR